VARRSNAIDDDVLDELSFILHPIQALIEAAIAEGGANRTTGVQLLGTSERSWQLWRQGSLAGRSKGHPSQTARRVRPPPAKLSAVVERAIAQGYLTREVGDAAVRQYEEAHNRGRIQAAVRADLYRAIEALAAAGARLRLKRALEIFPGGDAKWTAELRRLRRRAVEQLDIYVRCVAGSYVDGDRLYRDVMLEPLEEALPTERELRRRFRSLFRQPRLLIRRLWIEACFR
jgi:hypothetical protein